MQNFSLLDELEWNWRIDENPLFTCCQSITSFIQVVCIFAPNTIFVCNHYEYF